MGIVLRRIGVIAGNCQALSIWWKGIDFAFAKDSQLNENKPPNEYGDLTSKKGPWRIIERSAVTIHLDRSSLIKKNDILTQDELGL